MLERLVKPILACTLLFNSCIYFNVSATISYPKSELYELEGEFTEFFCRKPKGEEQRQAVLRLASTFKRSYESIKSEMKPGLFYREQLKLVEERIEKIEDTIKKIEDFDYNDFYECRKI